MDRIDTHFHIVLDCYVQAINAAGGDPSGMSQVNAYKVGAQWHDTI